MILLYTILVLDVASKLAKDIDAWLMIEKCSEFQFLSSVLFFIVYFTYIVIIYAQIPTVYQINYGTIDNCLCCTASGFLFQKKSN